MADEHGHHRVHYLLIFIVLCIFTGLSVLCDVADMKGKEIFGLNGTILLAFLVLAVAVAKALCVMLFFMHLKFERNWKYVFLGPTTILAIGLPLALLPDIGVHYYKVDVPQPQSTVDADGHAPPEQESTQQEH